MATEEESIEELLGGTAGETKVDEEPTGTTVENKEETQSTDGYWSSFGEFESEEKFKETFNSLKEKATKYEEDSILWNKKQEELEKTIEAEKANRNLYITDDKLARLNVLKNKDEEEFKFYKSIVLDEKTDPKSIIAAKTAKKYKDLTQDEINSYISEKYGLDREKPDEDDFDYPEDYNKALSKYERDMKINNIKMREDADSILGEYMKDFNSIELPYNKPISKEELVIKQNTNLEKWTPHIKDLTKSIGEMSFKINYDKEEIPFNFSMNEEQIETYSKVLSKLVHDNVIEFNDEGRKSVSDIMQTIIIKDQLQTMLNSTYDKAVEDISAKYEKAINGGKMPHFTSSGKGEVSSEDEAIDKMLSQFE